MDKEIASSLLAQTVVIGEQLSELISITNKISDKEEIAKFRKIVGDAMVLIGIDFVEPIVKQYPDLDPDKEYKEQKKRREAYAAEHKSLIPLERDKANEIYKLALSIGKDLYSMLGHVQENHIEYEEIKKGIYICGDTVNEKVLDILRQRYWDIDRKEKTKD